VIYSYKLFCDLLPKEESSKCLLLMHTSPIDEHGTDLIAVKNDLCKDYDVKFTSKKVDMEVLNQYYNAVDCTINIANNEGFGLATAESIMAGTPIIVNVTGGLQDQCGFNIDGEPFNEKDFIKIGSLHDKSKWSNLSHGEWVIPVWPSAINLNGSPATPYIFDDRVNNFDVRDAIMKMYKLGKEKRKDYGKIGRDWATRNLSSEIMCQKFVNGIESVLKNYKKRKKYDLYKIV
jgi:glycosyltransferase involved in cell wall biosynthesis